MKTNSNETQAPVLPVHEIKVYGRSKDSTYRALTDYLIQAETLIEAGRIARETYAVQYSGMDITAVESGGIRYCPGNGIPC